MPEYEFTCRKAGPGDDAKKIAEYIYLTDSYIYPEIADFPEEEGWRSFVSFCLEEEGNIFSKNNISVILCKEEIIGIACVIPCGKKFTAAENAELSGIIGERIKPVIKGYFVPLAEENDSYEGYNITNVCIDEKYRGKGAGSALMRHCIDEYGEKTLHLDVIASNSPAIALYKKFGFEIELEYMGFTGDESDLPCYHMVRRK